MSLSCNCDFDKDDFESWYYDPTNFSELKTHRRQRCKSCKQLIDIGSTVLEFFNYRHPSDEIEERCKSDEIQTGSFFMCENCGEIFLNLRALNFCLDIFSESMADHLKEYHEITGFKKEIK